MHSTRLNIALLLASGILWSCAPHDEPSPPAPTPESTASVRWQPVAADVAKLTAFLEARIAQQAARRAMLDPAEQAGLQVAESALPQIREQWRQAETAYFSGDTVDALDQAEAVRTLARDALARVGIDAQPAPPDKSSPGKSSGA